jgi:hypothetical protein
MRINANNFIARSLCGVALAMLISTTPPEISRATTRSYNKNVRNLAGTWKINRKKSDDPENKLRKATSRGHGGGLRDGRSSDAGGLPEGGGFPRRPPIGGVPDGGNSSDREEMEIVRTRMEERMRAAEVLEIIQTDSEITVNDTGDDRFVHTQTFYSDARKSVEDTEQGKIVTQARWQDNKFIVVTKEPAGKITRIYELKSGGRELYVTLKIENERMPQAISIRSIYDKTL